MKRFLGLIAAVVLIFAAMIAAANIVRVKSTEKSISLRNVYINRFTDRLQRIYEENEFDLSETQINAAVGDIFSEMSGEYEQNDLPYDVRFMAADKYDLRLFEVKNENTYTALGVVTDEKGAAGFVVFYFDNAAVRTSAAVMNVSMAVCAFAAVIVLLYVYFRIIKPFNALCEYPQKLSKGEFSEKISESPNRYFGRFIWGINMLSDRLSADKKRIDRLLKDKQTLMTTIAHGVKTPVSNIRLYADAIASGLYRKDGIPDEGDSEIAEKISRNTEEITELVSRMISTASDGIIDFEPDIQPFYSKEIADWVREEYSNRFAVMRVPFTAECLSDVIVKSDKNGVIRIISQLVENALKYGDGGGISLIIEKQDDGFYFTLRNKGEPIPEKELPYIWGSFWRGSNAEGIEGSGIGLFEAKKIALKLSGDICCKRMEETCETEFTLYIPL